MNNDNQSRLWAYVHGELNTEERQAMERALQDDRELRDEAERIKLLDRELRTLVPLIGRGEAELERTVLEAWEQSPEALDLKRGPMPVPLGVSRSESDGRRFQVAWGAVAAIAACMLLMLGGHFLSAPAVEWTHPDIAGPAAIRGTGAPLERLYAAEEMQNFSAALGNAVMVAYNETLTGGERRPWFRMKPEWKLRAHFQELRGGNFVVQVEAFEPDKTEMMKEWTQYFSSREDFSSSMTSYARMMAGDLHQMKTKP
jgi:hypothetical protein